MAEEKKDRFLGYAFNWIADIGAGQQIQITGSLVEGATKEQIDAEFEKFRGPIEKQRTRSVIPGLKTGIMETERRIAGYQAQMARLEAARGNKAIPSSELGAREQIITNLEADKALIAEKKKLLEECLKELE